MDLDLLLWLQELRESSGGVLDDVMMSVSNIVSGFLLYLFIGSIYWCIDKRAGTFMCICYSFGGVANQLVKNTACVYRPWIRNPAIVPVEKAMETATGYSFPSGHSQLSATVFGSAAVWQKKRVWAVILCVLATLLIMFSRMYLGAHTPQDVLVGAALSCIVIILNCRLMKWLDEKPDRNILIFAVGMAVCAIYLIYTTIKPYPVDHAADGTILVEPSKMIADCYAMAALEACGQAGIYAAKAFQTFILFFFIIAVYPAIMKLTAKIAAKKSQV